MPVACVAADIVQVRVAVFDGVHGVAAFRSRYPVFTYAKVADNSRPVLSALVKPRPERARRSKRGAVVGMTVLVPLDGSSFAERALPWGRALAQGRDATLVLVRAMVLRARTDTSVAARTKGREEAEQYLSTVAKRLRPGLRVETVVYDGPADGAILAETAHYQADLLVMATHTRPPLGGLLYGSVARAVLQHSPVPVLLIRSWSSEAAVMPTETANRILVPLDGSPFGEEALPPALAIAQALHAAVTLVRVAPVPERLLSGTLGLLLAATEPDEGERVADVERYLDGIGQRLKALDPLLTVQADARVGDPVNAIVEAERDHAATVVVMATHGRGGLGHILLGSIAEGVLRAGTVPVLFVRPRSTLRMEEGALQNVGRGHVRGRVGANADLQGPGERPEAEDLARRR